MGVVDRAHRTLELRTRRLGLGPDDHQEHGGADDDQAAQDEQRGLQAEPACRAPQRVALGAGGGGRGHPAPSR